jgi:6-hydroxytryprostatin B O-methyltransferase
MAMTSSLFREHTDGQSVAHSATSALLARDPNVYAYATYMCAGSAPVALQMAAAASKWGPNSTRTSETAFNVALDTDLPFFEYLSSNPAKMAEFSAYMHNVRSSDGVALRHLVAGFAWGGIRDGGAVVDVGGSTGGAAVALAEAFPHLHFVVQDLTANVESGQKLVEESSGRGVAARITFQGHDFMKPQPVRGANAYLLRMILHDWPDEQAARIVRNIVDAMDKDQPESRLLIMDTVLPRPGSAPVSVERLVRARDMTMIQAFNSKERDLDDWKNLLVLANPNLALVNVIQPFGSAMAVLEVAFKAKNTPAVV